MEKLLEKKTAIITGAANGVGQIIAQKFSEEGANLILADMDESNLKKEADLIVVEPNIKSIKGFNLHSIESAIENADLAVILVNHREFNLNKFRSQLSKIEALNFCGII